MKAYDAMIVWSPDVGTVDVLPHPDRANRSDGYQMSVGACFSSWRQRTAQERLALLFIEFHTLVVRDGIDPQTAHRAFLKIDEYRKHIAPDIEGAEE